MFLATTDTKGNLFRVQNFSYPEKQATEWWELKKATKEVWQALFLEVFFSGFQDTSTQRLDNVLTDDPRHSRLLTGFPSVGLNVILTIHFLEKKSLFDFWIFWVFCGALKELFASKTIL